MINSVGSNTKVRVREINEPDRFFMDQPPEMSYNITEPGSIGVKVEDEIDKPMGLSQEPAGQILRKHLKTIKRAIKKKIGIYEPLDFKTTFNGFLHRLHDEGIGALVQLPAHRGLEVTPEALIKNFLIENAYYALAEQYIQRIIMNKAGISDPHEIKVLEMVDFVRERLEKEGLKKLKTFQEKCKFKTFLTTAVNRLFIDYWRQKRSEAENVAKHGLEIEKSLHQPVDDPAAVFIKTGDEEFKKKAAGLLPQVLERLDYREKLALKLKYEKGLNISAIARTLGRSRYKTEQWLNQIETRISGEILSGIKRTAPPGQKGGRYEAP